MLFSAGMGIGLVFNGVAEPLSHFVSPLDVSGNEPGSQAAANSAVVLSLFHWGLHAWGIYALVGLGLAYMTYRYGRPLSVRWLLEPIMGRRLIESWVGNLIDTVAIIGTVFGVATSLGLGVLQIQAGLAHLGWFEPSNTLVIALVVGITAAGTVSVVSGVDRGIRWLSNSNMGMAALLAVVVLVAGPTVFLVRSVVQNSGEYLQTIPQLAFVTGAGVDDGWTLGWTLFNQAWFLSWAPVVGMFIARISRGRTIREFILGVLLAPTAVSIVWLTIFGGSGIFYQLDDGSLVGDDGTVDSDTSLFQMLNELPIGNEMASALAIVAIIVIMLFFITSVDSCSLVVDVLSHGGRSETPRQTRVFWAVLVGLCGGVLLLAGGEAALTVLQVSSLAGAAPLSIVYALGMVSLWKLFRYEVAVMPRYVGLATRTSGAGAGTRTEATAVQPDSSLREIIRDSESERRPREERRGFSVSLAGLSTNTGAGGEVRADEKRTVLAVHDIAPENVSVDEASGQLQVDPGETPQDPIGSEIFDTAEFERSAAGANFASATRSATRAAD